MTLVVDRKRGKELFLFADTQITKHDAPEPLAAGVIKIAVIDPNTCVAFAGSPDLASREIARFVDEHEPPARFADIRKFFQLASSNTGVDFLVGLASTVGLFKFTMGKCEKPQGTAWIGDHQAFSAFRHFEHASTGAWGARYETLMTEGCIKDREYLFTAAMALQHLINEPGPDSVGGFLACVSNSEGPFEYRWLTGLLYSRLSTILDSKGQQSVLAEGEDRQFNMAILSSRDTASPGIAFHFPNAGLTYLFLPSGGLVMDRVEVIQGPVYEEIFEHCKREFGVPIEGILVRHT